MTRQGVREASFSQGRGRSGRHPQQEVRVALSHPVARPDRHASQRRFFVSSRRRDASSGRHAVNVQSLPLTRLASTVFPTADIVGAVVLRGGLEGSITRLTLRESGRQRSIVAKRLTDRGPREASRHELPVPASRRHFSARSGRLALSAPSRCAAVPPVAPGADHEPDECSYATHPS